MTKVGYDNLTVNEGMQWEESGVSVKMCDIIVVWHTYHWWQVRQSLSPYRVGLIKRISGQTDVSLYGFVAAAVAVRRHTRTLSRGATWRYTVGRPAASTLSSVEVPR